MVETSWEISFVSETCHVASAPPPGLLVVGLTIYTFRPLASDEFIEFWGNLGKV